MACMSRYNLTTYHGALPPEGAESHTRKTPGVLPARLDGSDTDESCYREGLHVYKSLPIANVLAILTNR